MGDLELSQLLSGAAGATAFIYAFLVLIRRGDSQQRENIAELKEQRDDWKTRAEGCEDELSRFRTEQRQIRHQLKGMVQRYWLLAVHWHQLAVDAGVPDNTGPPPEPEDLPPTS